MIVAVVLAAGRSSRLGTPKALLQLRGETFIARMVATLTGGGAHEVVVITSPDGESSIRAALHGLDAPATIAINATPERGQLSSLLTALDAVADKQPEAILVTPVDLPLLSAGTVRAVLAAYRGEPRPAIVRATYRGEHGHPVLFDRRLFGELHDASPNVGAREVTQRHAATVCNVEVDDPGLLNDVDTWDDYERLIR